MTPFRRPALVQKFRALCVACAAVAWHLSAPGAQGDEAVRDSAATVRYVPANPSRVAARWAPWLKKLNEIVGVVGGAAKSKAVAEDVLYEALRAGLDPEFVVALVEAQSKFDERATSPRGNLGLMLLTPQVHIRLGNPVNNLYQGKYNLRLGCSLLRHYLDLEQGNLETATRRFLAEASDNPRLSFEDLWRLYEARRHSLRQFNPSPR